MPLTLVHDDVTEEPEAEGLGDPPKLSGTAIRGLPPKRKRLAEFQAWRRAVDAEIAKLEAGRGGLLEQIGEVDSAKSKVVGLVAVGAETLLSRIKNGAAWGLGQVVTFEHKDATAKLAASESHLAIANAALDKIEAELAARKALRIALEARQGEFLHAALREHGQELGTAYGATLATLRAQMGQLEGLLHACSESKLPADGSYVPPQQLAARAEAPGYAAAGHHGPRVFVTAYEVDIVSARAAWDSLARAWQHDPKADPGKILKFPPLAKPEYPSPTTANRKG